jgi:23S rRNA (cytosine1962-C5)-methyltransferase
VSASARPAKPVERRPVTLAQPPREAMAEAVGRALERRRALIESAQTQAFRALNAEADGVAGVFVDVYGPGATLVVHQGVATAEFETSKGVREAARGVLDALAALGVKGVYYKPFARDRSRLGGALPEACKRPVPVAGEALPEAVMVREVAWSLEVRLFDGLSTGLFLDQRDNRMALGVALARLAKARGAKGQEPPKVLNTFAYTCAFSVAAARGGSVVTSVDVSAKYLDWGRRNFAHNSLDESGHRFARMGTMEFLAYARRKGLSYDLIVLDPPSFASGSKRGKAGAAKDQWSSERDYPGLVHAAAMVLAPGGSIFASTNTLALCRRGALEKVIVAGLKRGKRRAVWLSLPATPVDVAPAGGRGVGARLAARWFTVAGGPGGTVQEGAS